MKKYLELFFLYVLAPIILLVDIEFVYKIPYFLIGFIYVGYLTIKEEKIEWKIEWRLKTRGLLVPLIIRFVFILIATVLFIYQFEGEKLFNVITTKPWLWAWFSVVYILLSVIPQEFLYRTFFFSRYRELFPNKWIFMAVNCLLFSFAHIWLQSPIVLIFTLVGGLFYFITYRRTQSLLFVCIEHAVYGIWLFTVGFGELFNFPV